VVLVVAAATSLGVALGSGGPAIPGAGMTPTAFVMSATRTTLTQRTADLVISGSITSGGTTIPVRGSGQADLTAGRYSADIQTESAGRSLTERELVVGGRFYLGITVSGVDASTALTGKHWVQIPVPVGGSSSALGTGTVDPLDQLRLLTKNGNTVRPLGTSVIDGVTVSGYSITPSQKTIDQRIQSEIDSGQLSPAAQQQLRTSSHLISSLAMNVWFDASGLMRRMGVDIGAVGATGTIDMTFENYGTAVTISPPAPGDVISYSDFATALQAAENAAK